MVKMLLLFIFWLFSTNSLADFGPERATLRHAKELAYGQHSMVVTNNPLASKTAQNILDQGGNAFDAAIAASFVLGLTEPQSSGLGGGGYALTWSRKDKKLQSYDGRETAPHSVNVDWFMNQDHQIASPEAMRVSVKSIATPSEVALLYKLHQDHGHLAWDKLLQPAIQLAQQGFPMSKRLRTLLNSDIQLLSRDAKVREIYFDNTAIKAEGALVKNPDYALTLMRIAKNPEEFYQGALADELITAINHIAKMEIYNKNDFSHYRVQVDEAVCSGYRNQYKICSVAPSASGGVTIQELMRIYADNYSGTQYSDTEWMYQFLEASKLSFADRDQYMADPLFVKIPVQALLEEQYIKQRSQLVGVKALPLPVAAGKPAGVETQYASDQGDKFPGTTSLVIVDKDDNAISMTLTVEHQFGSHIFTHGFFLNNQLTDFSFMEKNAEGKLIANRIQPGKRPRSSIAASMVFDDQQQLYALTGSPGGGEIICYVAKNLILMLDMKLSADVASATPNLCSTNFYTVLERGMTPATVASYLTNKGEQLELRPMVSGVTNIIRNHHGGWNGAADPRREGVAIGN